MNKIPNRQAICEVLMDKAKEDKDIMVLCSDSRGSASMTPFADNFPDQFIETGIAEQNLVSISAGLAKCGKKPFACSPACFLSTRSYEQAKVDVAYSNTNVTLIGISGGISYGALGMSHHSAQDIAAMSAIPNMRVYLPSDRHQTKHLIEALLKDEKPSYIRVGRNPVEDIYTEGITKITDRDIAYAKKMGAKVKIFGSSKKVGDKVSAMVAPQLIYPEHPLYSVDGVFNAILVKGNMVGDVMFYGQGAGKLATASAVVSDVMDAAKHAGVNIITLWDAEKLDLVAAEDARNVFFVRVSGIKAQKSDKVKELFGNVKMVDAGYDDEFAFVTEEMSEGEYQKAAEQLEGVINKIRVDQTGLADLSFAILFDGVINDRILDVELDLLNLFAVDTF